MDTSPSMLTVFCCCFFEVKNVQESNLQDEFGLDRGSQLAGGFKDL